MTGFVTLGPGTNHELVALAYLAFHGLGPEGLCFVPNAVDGARMVRVDRIIGSPDDAWVVFGRTRASAGGLIADRNSFVGQGISRVACPLIPIRREPG